MVSDWQAMSEEIKLNTARQWFEKQKDVRWHFSKHQEQLIDKLIKVFETTKKEEFIKEDKEATYTAFVSFSGGVIADEEIDVVAKSYEEACRKAQAELKKDYQPGGKILRVEKRFGIFY
jgi:superoxide dismutase